MSEFHTAVLREDSIQALITNKSGIYVDLTFGGGGHSMTILNSINAEGYLFAFDQDDEALENQLDDKRFTLFKSNFKYFGNFLDYLKIDKVDGILADLGVSSWQFDSDERGFSFRFEQALDMRMNTSSELTAAKILNSYNQDALVEIFSAYGEVRNAKTLAREIIKMRNSESWKTTNQLNRLLERLYMGERKRYFSQVYQAIRIEVNEEMESLKEMLSASATWLKKDGRLVVISYHSVEDRLVKRFIQNGNFSSEKEVDDFGNVIRPLKKVGKGLMVPSREEILENPRARSAKLRVAEKL